MKYILTISIIFLLAACFTSCSISITINKKQPVKECNCPPVNSSLVLYDSGFINRWDNEGLIYPIATLPNYDSTISHRFILSDTLLNGSVIITIDSTGDNLLHSIKKAQGL